MAINGGASPLEQFRNRLDAEATRCSACGAVDHGGGWRVAADGNRVRYHRECGSCRARETRELNLR